MRPRLVVISVASVALCCLLSASVGWMLFFPDLSGRQIPDQVAFDRVAWLGWRANGSLDARLAMKDAAAREIRLGMTPTQLREVLGNPSADYSDSDNWWYYLGPEPGPFSVDSLWLAVEFRDGRVVDVREVTD